MSITRDLTAAAVGAALSFLILSPPVDSAPYDRLAKRQAYREAIERMEGAPVMAWCDEVSTLAYFAAKARQEGRSRQYMEAGYLNLLQARPHQQTVHILTEYGPALLDAAFSIPIQPTEDEQERAASAFYTMTKEACTR